MHIQIKKELKKSRAFKAGVALLSTVLLAALFAPWLAFYDPMQQTMTSLLNPSWIHLLGTNHVGQDIWSQLLYGARTSLIIGFAVGIISTVLATFFGVSTALIGGAYDKIVMRIVDALIIIPAVIVAILFAAYFKPNVLLLILLLSSLTWQGGARVVRAQVLSLKNSGHIVAAGAFGASRVYLAMHHIVPELGPIILVDFIHGVRRAVFMEAGLAFLGISDPMVISWGIMMRESMNFSFLNVWQWWLVPTGIALSITIVGLTLIGYTFEPILDPRLRGALIAAN